MALPLLVAMVLGAWFAHRRVFWSASGALVLFLAAVASWWSPALHVALAALAAAATAVATAQLYRGKRPGAVAWRDYVALTKPRIMSLLLLTGAAGMFVGAQGLPGCGLFAAMLLAWRWRRRERAEPRARPGHRPLDEADEPGRSLTDG